MNTATNSPPLIRDSDGRWFQGRLLDWFTTHGRDFAWRQEHDPYAILMAELMLHRTQARQVEPVYYRFMERFVSLRDLATAEEIAVIRVLAPLGLEWRAAKFIPMARQLDERYFGRVPDDRDALLTLPGVGPYVADAVRVLAFDHSAVFVDTNTVRVAGRYFGFPTHADSRRNRSVQPEIARLIDSSQPRDSNLALLDLAALLCRPTRPRCDYCPVAARCAYGNATRTGC